MDEIEVINRLEQLGLSRKIYLTFAVAVLGYTRGMFLTYFPAQAARYDSLVTALTNIAAGQTVNLSTLRTQLKTALDVEALANGCNTIRRELLYAVWRLIATHSTDEQRIVDFCFSMACAYAKQSSDTYDVVTDSGTVTFNWSNADFRQAVVWMRNKLMEVAA
jgi:phage gp29-like protein